jgi:hypothetical protein
MENDFLSTRLDPKTQKYINKGLRAWVPWYKTRRFIVALATVALAIVGAAILLLV